MPSAQAIAERVKRELGYYRCLISHPKTPKLAKVLLGVAVAYFISPIDLIPDVIPILGQLDDVLIVPGLIWLALRMVPPDVVAVCRQARCDSIDSLSQRG